MKRFLAVFLSVMLVLGVAGCRDKAQDDARSAFEKLMTAICDVDMEKAGKYLDTGSLTGVSVDDLDGADAVIEAVFSKLEWEIVSCTASDNDEAVLAAKLTTIDLTAVLEQCTKIVMDEYANGTLLDEELESRTDEVFREEIAKSDLPKITNEIDITVKRFEDGWKVEMSDELRDAVSAGFLGQIEKAKQSMQNF
ncbi:MAG: hypothetical protein IJN96_08140 [Clostridia bacterium]|nr:hypothetical protein [Clostridia bacterium]